MGVAFHEGLECHVSEGGWSSFVWLSPGEPPPPGPGWEKRYQVEGSPVSGEGREKVFICREEGKGTEFLSWIYGWLDKE